MCLGKHRKEIKDTTVKRTDDYIEGRCHIRLLDFRYSDRKRERGHWQKCVIYCTEDLTEIEGNIPKIQQTNTKWGINE